MLDVQLTPDTVDAVTYELREQIAHDPRGVLKRLKAALGDVKYAALCKQLLVMYDERIEARRAALPLLSADLPEGTLDDGMPEEAET